MKNLLIASSLFIIVSGLLSSCGSSVSIVKRHYNKGYYISFSKHTPVEHLTTTIAKSKEMTRKVDGKGGNGGLPELTAKTEDVKTLNFKRIAHIAQNFPVRLSPPPISVLPPVKVSENPLLQSRKANYDSPGNEGNSSDHAALSLLWLVILVILILWLIGILAGNFGLGPLINLLLVIALVLLILWLLRII